MKKILLSCIATSIIFLSIVSVTQATMIDLNDYLVRDSFTNEIWYRDVNAFSNQTYAEQLASIAALSLTFDINGDGFNDNFSFEMATQSDVSGLLSNYNLPELGGTDDDATARKEFLSHFSLSFDQTEVSATEYADGVDGRVVENLMGLRVFQYYQKSDNSFAVSGNAFVFGGEGDDNKKGTLGAYATANYTLGGAPPRQSPNQPQCSSLALAF